MENASQALLIAGGVLLAILTLSTLVLMFNNINTIQGAQLSKEETQRLAKWNAEWEAYNKKLLYGTEVLTVINKAIQNNNEFAGNNEYQVNVYLYDKNGTTEIPGDPKVYVESFVKAKDNKIYSCMEMSPNVNTGRIQEIKFKIVE